MTIILRLSSSRALIQVESMLPILEWLKRAGAGNLTVQGKLPSNGKIPCADFSHARAAISS
jgi:hypothetical protein